MYDSFRIEGGCWCPDDRTLRQLRIGGHTEACKAARRGWEANKRHMTALSVQKREDEEAGRQMREAAMSLLEKAE